jgi:hypothetical protein
MGFRDREKKRQSSLGSKFFENDTFQGKYRNIPRFFCLKDNRKNLYKAHRHTAVQYFQNRNITWHDGGTGRRKHDLSSNHLCCSQCCCVNFNFPFMNDAIGLKSFLKSLGYSVKKVLPIYLDKYENEALKNYIGFEWIGEKNYLNERIRKNAQRTRGEYFTSADFIIRFQQEDNKIRILLGEWKYTENYTKGKSIRYSRAGTDRLNKIYRPFLKAQNCQIKISNRQYHHLFYDPFDQLMRLQLLSTEMEKAGEMGADIVSTIHIVPKANKEFNLRMTSPGLKKYGKTVHEIWSALVPDDRFKGFYLENILNDYCRAYQDKKTSNYIEKRYGNMK